MDVRLSQSNLPNEGVVNVITKLRNFTICNKGLLHKINTIICKQLGYPTAASVECSLSLSSLMHQSFIPGNVKCDARVNDLSQCAIIQNNDCSQYSYVTCHVCDNPLLKNAEKFPDSWFTAFPKSRSASKARISSGSSCCAPAADGNYYFQLNFPSLYTVNVIAIFGDSSSSSFVTKYHLQTNIDGVNWKSEKSQNIYLGNKNGYNNAAIEKFSGGLKSKALRIFPLKFVGAPCIRVEICGGDLLPDKPTDLIATKSASTYLEISWKHPQNTGVKLGTNISNPLTRYVLILLKDTMIVFDKTLEVTDKKPYNITNLVPYATYKVNVTAGNSEGFGRSTTATFKTAEDVAPELSTKQIGSTLTYLLQNPNLEYRYFYVVAMKNGTEESRLPSNFKNTDLMTYSKAISSTQPIPYIAVVVSRRDFTPDFTLGDGENTTRRSNGENYYNGPLKPGTSYKIFQRVFMNYHDDYYSTDWSPVATTAQKHKSSDGGNTGAIAGAVVAAVLVIILVILGILFVRINSNSATVQ
ncbi:uncharacterized protein LOC124450290 [Xenia sp. Carnegie-2017]|uniref:uncharacterized protein LOC124450290 n=1 Tax=Xenia sp. Carnegie-2017 TaxID=2897299 RepID=UPI001F03DCE1|nr:uncharacterized protein LOC124450290 [Xenia sp. Carnegie-2017]